MNRRSFLASLFAVAALPFVAVATSFRRITTRIVPNHIGLTLLPCRIARIDAYYVGKRAFGCALEVEREFGLPAGTLIGARSGDTQRQMNDVARAMNVESKADLADLQTLATEMEEAIKASGPMPNHDAILAIHVKRLERRENFKPLLDLFSDRAGLQELLTGVTT